METLAWVKQTMTIPRQTKKNSKREKNDISIKKKCIAQAQKAVIMCPDRIETWSVLIAALGKGNSLVSTSIPYSLLTGVLTSFCT